MKSIPRRSPFILCAAIFLCALLLLISIPAFADSTVPTDAIYLGNCEDNMIAFAAHESMIGWNTAHSGEPITIGSRSFTTGIGLHCAADDNTYVEFDISSLNMNNFASWVGVLQNANYFVEWGSIQFEIYGDGVLLATSPVCHWNEEPVFLSCSVAGVKTLKLAQKNVDGISCDAGVWGDPYLTVEEIEIESTTEAETVFDPSKTDEPQPADLVSADHAYVSDLYWMDSKTYSGNIVVRDGNTANEYIMSANGDFFYKGLGFHASSDGYTSYIDVNIDGLGYTKFASYYGICETMSGNDISMAAVRFAVFGDGELLFESDVMNAGVAMVPMNCDVTGVKTLRIAIAGAPSIAGAWGTWGGAVLSKSGEITENMMLGISDTPETEPEVNTETEPLPETLPEADTETEPEVNTETEPLPETLPEADTEIPTGSESDTEVPTDTQPSTETATDVDTDGEDQTEKDESGCSSTLTNGALLLLLLPLFALVLTGKRKEHTV